MDSIPTISLWKLLRCMTYDWARRACFLFMRLLWAIQRWDRQRTRIARLHLKIHWLHSDTTSRIPHTSPMMFLLLVLPIAPYALKPPASTAESPMKTAENWTQAKLIRGPAG